MVRPNKEPFIETSLKECLEQINLKLDNHLKHTESNLEKLNERIEKLETEHLGRLSLRIEQLELSQSKTTANLEWIKWISVSLFIGILGLVGKAIFIGG